MALFFCIILKFLAMSIHISNDPCDLKKSRDALARPLQPIFGNPNMSEILTTESPKAVIKNPDTSAKNEETTKSNPTNKILSDELPTPPLDPVSASSSSTTTETPTPAIKNPVTGEVVAKTKETTKPEPSNPILNDDLPPPTLDPVSANTSSSLSLLKFAQALKELNVKKIGDDFDEATADLIKYNFGLDNEDKYLNSTELITKCGYPMEKYTVQTSDGYLLEVINIPGEGPPVLIMHGFMGSPSDFLTSGCEKSLAYVVSNDGYDVWLGNARGNKYARKHVTHDPNIHREFWNFDWHEIGVIDLPTMIDFILEKTDRQKLYYIGHSQGTTTPYVLFSERPEYNDKIILLVTISPVAWMSHSVSPLLQVLSQFLDDRPFLDQAIGNGEFMPGYEFTNVIKTAICGTSATAVAVCNPMVSSMFGFNPEQVDFSQYPVQSSHLPCGASTRQLIHFLQMINSGRFQQFDYGEENNSMIYGQSTPPDYDVTKITSKTVIFYSDNDWVSSPIDVDILLSNLPNLQYYYKVPPFSHLDFLWGKNAYDLVYLPILDLLNDYPAD